MWEVERSRRAFRFSSPITRLSAPIKPRLRQPQTGAERPRSSSLKWASKWRVEAHCLLNPAGAGLCAVWAPSTFIITVTDNSAQAVTPICSLSVWLHSAPHHVPPAAPLLMERPMKWGMDRFTVAMADILRTGTALSLPPPPRNPSNITVSDSLSQTFNFPNQIKQIGIISYSEPISILPPIWVLFSSDWISFLLSRWLYYSLQSPQRAASLQPNSPAKYNLLLMEHLIWLPRTAATVLTLVMCPYGF